MPLQLCIEVYRFKISQNLWGASSSRKIVAFVEGQYKRNSVKSEESKLYLGSVFHVPWKDTMSKFTIHYFLIDGLLTIDLGSSEIDVTEDFRKDIEVAGTAKQVRMNIYQRGCTERCGKMLCNLTVQDIFDNGKPIPDPKPKPSNFEFSLPGFRFKRLNRACHWERIRSTNIEKVTSTNDIRSLLTCIDDVTTGDISQEDVDPKLNKTIQMAQYTSQYMLACRNLMQSKKQTVTAAMRTFDDEEAALDLKLAKLRSRKKALERESRDMDSLASKYTATLDSLNPKLLDELYNTYVNKMNPPRVDSYGVREVVSSQGPVKVPRKVTVHRSDDDDDDDDNHYKRPADKPLLTGKKKADVIDPWASTHSENGGWTSAQSVSRRSQEKENTQKQQTLEENQGNSDNAHAEAVRTSKTWAPNVVVKKVLSKPVVVAAAASPPLIGGTAAATAAEQTKSNTDTHVSVSEGTIGEHSASVPVSKTAPTATSSGEKYDIEVKDFDYSFNAEDMGGSKAKKEEEEEEEDPDIIYTAKAPSAADRWGAITPPDLESFDDESVDYGTGHIAAAAAAATTTAPPHTVVPAVAPQAHHPAGATTVAESLAAVRNRSNNNNTNHNNNNNNIVRESVASQMSVDSLGGGGGGGGRGGSTYGATAENGVLESIDEDSLMPRPTASLSEPGPSGYGRNKTFNTNASSGAHSMDSDPQVLQRSASFPNNRASYQSNGTDSSRDDFPLHSQQLQLQPTKKNIDLALSLNSGSSNTSANYSNPNMSNVHAADDSYIAEQQQQQQRHGGGIHAGRGSSATAYNNNGGRGGGGGGGGGNNFKKAQMMIEEDEDDPFAMSASWDASSNTGGMGGAYHNNNASMMSDIDTSRSIIVDVGGGGKGGAGAQAGGSGAGLAAYSGADTSFTGSANNLSMSFTHPPHLQRSGSANAIKSMTNNQDNGVRNNASYSNTMPRTSSGGNMRQSSSGTNLSQSVRSIEELGNEDEEEGYAMESFDESLPDNNSNNNNNYNNYSSSGNNNLGESLNSFEEVMGGENDEVLMGTSKYTYGGSSGGIGKPGDGTMDFGMSSTIAGLSKTLGATTTIGSRSDSSSVYNNNSNNNNNLGGTTGSDAFEADSLAGGGDTMRDSMRSSIGGGDTDTTGHAGASNTTTDKNVLQLGQSSRANKNNSILSAVSERDRSLSGASDTAAAAVSWRTGRAPSDLLELAKAFDVHIGAIKLERNVVPSQSSVQLNVEFMGVVSPPSAKIIIQPAALQTLSFSSWMEVASEEAEQMVRMEISEFAEGLAFQVNVIAPNTNLNDSGNGEEEDDLSPALATMTTPNLSQYIIGQANVDLWGAMVEDKVNILRQEVDILSLDMSQVIGCIVVDVRGHRLITRCS